MKTVKIRCFSAINGEKTFEWNGLGEWLEPSSVRFRTDRDDYRFAWSKQTVTFERKGELPLELEWSETGRSLAKITTGGQVLSAECTVIRIQINEARLDVLYRMEGQDDLHRIHLDWTLEGRN